MVEVANDHSCWWLPKVTNGILVDRQTKEFFQSNRDTDKTFTNRLHMFQNLKPLLLLMTR